MIVYVSPAAAATQSANVLLVPSASGQAGHGGMFPTTGFPGGFAPTFTNGSLASIEDPASNPLTPYDTVVLVQVCDIDSYLANATFKTRIEQFVSNGGKLIIWDSECQNTDYSNFVFPFTTNNPGALGSNAGSLNDVEPNSLSNTNPASPYYVDLPLIATDTDAVGDANVMASKDPHWFVDLTATNANNFTGPLQTYARLGKGLIIYCGFDMDYLPGAGFDPTSSAGVDQLARIWYLQLLQPWNPDNLPATVRVVGELPSAGIGVFLCYSQWQVEPGVWPFGIAVNLMKGGGYWLPYALPGNTEWGTNIGGYHLVCNLGTAQSAGGLTLGAGEEVWNATAAKGVSEFGPFYPIVGG